MYLNLWRAFRDGREIKDFIREQVNYNLLLVSPVKVTFNMEATVKLAVFEKDVATELLKFK